MPEERESFAQRPPARSIRAPSRTELRRRTGRKPGVSFCIASTVPRRSIRSECISQPRRELRTQKREPGTVSKPHDVESAIYVDYFSRNAGARVRGQKDSGASDFVYVDIAAERSALGVGFVHIAEAGDAASGEGLDGTGGNGVHSNIFLSQLVGEVAHGAFKPCLGDRHHVVSWHDFFRRVVS